jgi:hypothetical protein
LSGAFAYVTEESHIKLVGNSKSKINGNTATYNGSLIFLDDSNIEVAKLNIENGITLNAGVVYGKKASIYMTETNVSNH